MFILGCVSWAGLFQSGCNSYCQTNSNTAVQTRYDIWSIHNK